MFHGGNNLEKIKTFAALRSPTKSNARQPMDALFGLYTSVEILSGKVDSLMEVPSCYSYLHSDVFRHVRFKLNS